MGVVSFRFYLLICLFNCLFVYLFDFPFICSLVNEFRVFEIFFVECAQQGDGTAVHTRQDSEPVRSSVI